MARKLYGILAEFDNPGALYGACEKVRDAGYREWDSFSPFPVHGIEEAMGFSWSKVPWIAAITGFTGAGLGFALQAWVSVFAYPLVISGKPLLSWQAFIPVTFEVGVLSTALGALVGMLVINGLPRLHHPLFSSKAFEKVTDDAFFIAIEAKDRKFDLETTRAFLDGIGATHIELVED
jgi:hypothetical protein